MLADACALTTSRKTQIDFQLKLAKEVAVHHHKFEVLEAIILSLYKLEGTEEFRQRAANMVESFCLLVGTQKHDFELGSPGL